MTQTWDAKTLKAMAERAYNYRASIGKDQFQSLFRFVEVLELAEVTGVDISTPQAFQNFITQIRTEHERRGNRCADEFRNKHAKPTQRKDLRNLTKKDWSKFIGIVCSGCPNDYMPVF